MHRITAMCIDAAIAALVLVPLFFLLDKYFFHSKRRTCLYILFAVYLSGMFAVAGLPDIRYIRYDPHFNFVPFAYMFSDYTNSLLNVVLFFPLGLCLPLFWGPFRRMWRTLVFGFLVSFLIEFLQIFTYRASDVNDLITNTLGTLLGWCIGKTLLHFFPGIRPTDRTREIPVICGSAFCVMYFLQPYLASWLHAFC